MGSIWWWTWAGQIRTCGALREDSYCQWRLRVLFLHSAVNPITEKFFYDIGTIICPKLIITILGKPAINIFLLLFFLSCSMVFEYASSENATGPCPSLLAIDDKFEAPVTASPIQTGLFIPTSFLPAFTTSSTASPIPIPAVIVGYFLLITTYSAFLSRC